jgi:uncharacterized membrane protein YbhN (UPF0104 family)
MEDGEPSGAGGRWRRLLQVAISGAAVYLIARHVDLREAARVLASARPSYVLAAVLLYLVGQVMSAYRWHMIGVSVGLTDSFAHYVRFYFIGMFFMFFGPSTLGGDLVRSLYLAEGDGRRGRAFNSVLFDRLNGLVVLIAIGAAAFVLFPGYGLPAPLFLATVIFGLGLFLSWWLAPVLVRLLLAPDHALRRFIEVDLGAFWRDRAMLVGASVVSLAFHLVQILTQLLVSRALGLAVPFSYICIFHPLVSALSAIPITISGIGLREGGYLWFLLRIGIGEASAVAYGGLWLLVIVANSLIGGLVFLASGARLPRLRAEKR